MKVRFSYEGLGQRFRDCQQRIRSVIEVRVYVFIGYCYCYCICVCIVLFLYILDIYILYIWLKPQLIPTVSVYMYILYMCSLRPRCLQATPRPCDTSSRACLWRGRCPHEGNRVYNTYTYVYCYYTSTALYELFSLFCFSNIRRGIRSI